MSDTFRLIAANLLSGLSMLLNTISITMGTKRKMILLQTFQNISASLGQALLHGYAGAVQDGVAAVRNLFVLKGLDKKPVKVFFVALAFVLGMALNNNGWLGYLLVAVATVYAAAVVCDQANEKTLKLVMLFTSVVWGSYDFVLQNYVKALGNAVSFGMAAVYLLRHPQGKWWGKETPPV